jgi:hypothetical protein
MFCLFQFFWPSKLLIQHLADSVDFTNLESTVTCCLILKLPSKNLQTMPVILFVFVDFHCFIIICVDMISLKMTFSRTVLDS